MGSTTFRGPARPVGGLATRPAVLASKGTRKDLLTHAEHCITAERHFIDKTSATKVAHLAARATGPERLAKTGPKGSACHSRRSIKMPRALRANPVGARVVCRLRSGLRQTGVPHETEGHVGRRGRGVGRCHATARSQPALGSAKRHPDAGPAFAESRDDQRDPDARLRRPDPLQREVRSRAGAGHQVDLHQPDASAFRSAPRRQVPGWLAVHCRRRGVQLRTHQAAARHDADLRHRHQRHQKGRRLHRRRDPGRARTRSCCATSSTFAS